MCGFLTILRKQEMKNMLLFFKYFHLTSCNCSHVREQYFRKWPEVCWKQQYRFLLTKWNALFCPFPSLMNGFILIAGQKLHIWRVNHIFVLQETSRNYSQKWCSKLVWSPTCMRKDIFARLSCKTSQRCRISLAVSYNNGVVLLHKYRWINGYTRRAKPSQQLNACWHDIAMSDGWFLLILAMPWCVCRTLRADGVCESVLYGLPLVLHPTTCWQLDWDEIAANNNLFHGLCHTLKVFLSFLSFY